MLLVKSLNKVYNILPAGCLFPFFVFKDGLNLTSSEERPQLLDNRTIQNIVMDYVDNYMGSYSLASYLVAIGGMQYLCIVSIPKRLNIFTFSTIIETFYVDFIFLSFL